MKFLCDEMLVRLGRWLRAAGLDTDIAGDGTADRDLLARARAEGRTLLTRDRKLTEHRDAAGIVVLLASDDVASQATEVGRRLAIDWLAAPFSRCLMCNTPLIDANAAARAALPDRARTGTEPVRACPGCGRTYWQGSHARRMLAVLRGFAKVL